MLIWPVFLARMNQNWTGQACVCSHFTHYNKPFIEKNVMIDLLPLKSLKIRNTAENRCNK